MLLKTWFLLLYFFSIVKSELTYFIQEVSSNQKIAGDFGFWNKNATGD